MKSIKAIAVLSLVSVVGVGFFFIRKKETKKIANNSVDVKKKISKNGINEIKRFEGWRSQVYLDSAGLATIGYGHLLKPNETYFMIDLDEGERILRQDVSIAENAVNDFVKVYISQNMFDALVSFVFNVGVNAFKNSTLLRLLNSGDYSGASAQLPRWNKAGGVVNQGLVNRRESEQQLFIA